MQRITAFVLDEHVDGVVRTLGAIGTVQIIDFKDTSNGEKQLHPEINTEMFNKCSGLLRRVHNLTTILGIESEAEQTKLGKLKIATLEKKLEPPEKDVIELQKNITKVLEDEELVRRDKKTLDFLHGVGVSYEQLRESRFLFVEAGLMDFEQLGDLDGALKEKLEDEYVLLTGKRTGGIVTVVVVVPKNHRSEVERILSTVKFEALKVSGRFGNTREVLEQKLLETGKTKSEFNERLQECREKYSDELLRMSAFLENEKKIAEVKLMFGKTSRVTVLDGWVPERRVEETVGKINLMTNDCSLVNVTKPETDDNVPVALENPEIVKPFESITESFGLPSYNEIDPTIFIALSFPLIFGMMFGDVGHGLVISLVGYLIWKLKRNGFGKILVSCGFSSMLFGFLYGSVFGYEELLHPLWLNPFSLVKAGEVKGLFGMMIFVGVLQMGLGILIDAFNRMANKNLKSTVVGSVGRFALFSGVVTLITKLFGFQIPFFVGLSNLPVPSILGFGIVVPVMAIVGEETLHEYSQSRSLKKTLGFGVDSLFEVMDTIVMFLGNTISYSRILILALVHAIMGFVIFTMAGLLAGISYIGIILYYLFVVAGTILLILGLEGLVVYIHTIRLHYYEWFSKFYRAGGVKYQPFKIIVT